MGVTTSAGLVQLLGVAPDRATPGLVPDRTFADPSAVATLTFRGAGSSAMRTTFDAAETRELERLAQERRGGPAGVGPGGVRSSLSFGVVPAPATAGTPGSPQPVRVGGNIRAPQKIKHVDPVMPEMARQAGVRGMVILEIVIGTDGTVPQAKVLRSIPLLDAAAIEAVTQWIYEPTHVNGVPVPVILTATVVFQ
jgi:TonB family protein